MGATQHDEGAPPDGAHGSIRLPKTTERWIVAGVSVSSVVLIIISFSSGVTFSQLEGPGFVFVALAVLAVLSKLMVQVLKFRVIAGGLTRGSLTDFRGVATARVGSEFVALTTPSFIGGEFVRAAWLARKGVEAGKALWIGFVEICIDVYVGSAVSLVAALVAFERGATTVAALIVIVIVPIMAGYAFFILLFARRGVRFPRIIQRIASRLLGRARAERIVSQVQGWADGFSAAAKSMGRQSMPTIALAVCLALVQAVLSGLILWLLLAPGRAIDLSSSILAVFGVQALASVPITIGGSGISELGLQWYLSAVYGFSSWATVVLWRLVSYQLVEVLTGGAFIVLLTRGLKRRQGE
ncbi:MAG TPA: lysylphosphatidylglycerol synthase domain-containing protein [Nitrososphaerales archaeon]|nr:lysylphosphatidylglycerol synthase domain-containing protein [Nitrososphaerales archaeon]